MTANRRLGVVCLCPWIRFDENDHVLAMGYDRVTFTHTAAGQDGLHYHYTTEQGTGFYVREPLPVEGDS